MNILRPGDSELVEADYGDLLEKILQALRNQNPFRVTGDRNQLIVDIDTTAAQVAELQVNNPLGTCEQRARTATIHFSPAVEERFPNQIRDIRNCLQQQLETALGQSEAIGQFVTRLATPLESFTGAITTKLGFKYPFNKLYSGLQKQRLILDPNRQDSNFLLKFHKLTITVRNTNEFQKHLQESLENHIDSLDISESDKEDVNYILQGMVTDEFSDFYQLQRVLDTESLGKLNKEAKIVYLEDLLANIGNADPQAVIYLEDLIRRLKLIEDYISDVNKSEGYYEVNYAGKNVNYKELFSRAEILDALPIIPIIVGKLGETTDSSGGDRTFIFGLKLKLNNAVQARGGQPSFDYHLNLLNPDSEEHKAELASKESFAQKVLKIAFLYFFVFACNDPSAEGYNPTDDLNYDPRSGFDTRILPILRGDDEEAKKKLFRRILRGFQQYNVRPKIDILANRLRNLLRRETILPTRNATRYLGVRRGILEQDTDNILNGNLFNEVLTRNPKESLRYISVSQSSVGSGALCQLPVNITIEDMRYFQAEERQQFSMEYDIKNIHALPLLWSPKEEQSRNIYSRDFKQNKLIVFPYDNLRLDSNDLNSTQAFVYRFTVTLLAYISLKILLDNSQNQLFIPQIRLHVGDHNNPSPSEEFTAALSKVLSHLFKEEHLSTSQGFRIRGQLDSNKIRNGLSSLYSILPKKFRFTDGSSSPNLDKLAIIVVSSRESDAGRSNRNRSNRKANLLGEVVSVERLEDGAIQIKTINTFSDNYGVRRLYETPAVLKDTVDNLYQSGFRHFLYIAQAPYSSTLHLTRSEQDEGLFFMSSRLISFLQEDHPDIKLYPVFFDKYYVRKRQNLQAMSLYIQDTRELTNLVEDRSKKTVVFFNLFNGKQVGKGEDRFYNGVISYSTLLNIYPGILDDQYIRQGLIDDTPLKNDLLQYITLFHFSRYEASCGINLKLDPYTRIIGDKSLGALSLFYHMNGSADFNSLAFLSKVKKALNVTNEDG